MKAAVAALHRSHDRLHGAPLGVRLEQLADARRDGDVPLELGRLVRAGQVAHAAVRLGRIVQGDPDADRVAAVERPVRVVQVPRGGIGPRELLERLVVPDPHAGDTGEPGHDLPELGAEEDALHRVVELPEVHALQEGALVVVGVEALRVVRRPVGLAELRVPGDAVAPHGRNRSGDLFEERIHFLLRHEVPVDERSVTLVLVDLSLRQRCVHGTLWTVT